MKRTWLRRITIRHRVVNSVGERQSPSGAQVIDKGMLHVDLKIADRKSATLASLMNQPAIIYDIRQ